MSGIRKSDIEKYSNFYYDAVLKWPSILGGGWGRANRTAFKGAGLGLRILDAI